MALADGAPPPPPKTNNSSQPQLQQHLTQHGDVFELPTFTMKQIHDAIPPHCFQPSTLRSMAYVVRDFAYVAALLYAATTYIPYLPNASARALAWAAYTVVQGMVMTGIWILAHECGHGGFSKNKTLNGIMGLAMHSFLLVPYHSWRITHSAHHKATGNIDKDTAFVPHLRESWVRAYLGADVAVDSVPASHLVEDAPLVTLWTCVIHQVLGWPGYLLFNLTGQTYDVGFPRSSHFYFGADSPFFKPDQLPLILLSDLGVGAMLALLGLWVSACGVWDVAVLYLIPYLWVNHWIVAITFLQHTDGSLPHYNNHSWSFARGATATIDRDLGFIDTHLFHDIIGTHVCHHLVSTIPFYHAGEASVAIRRVMGRHYRADTTTPFLWAFWRNQRLCKFIEESVDGSGIYFFRNLHGTGAAPKDLTAGKTAAVEGAAGAKTAAVVVVERNPGPTAMSTAMSSSRNLNAKRRLSHGIPATLPMMAE